MPVKIPDGLPAAKALEEEGIFVMPETRALTQDFRPLRIAIVNIMPLKSVTEGQLLRLLSNSPLQATVTFLHLGSHTSKNTPQDHLARFYRNFEEVRGERFDCLIVTGAPVETMEFTDVTYWDELRRVMDWARTHVYSSLYLCWGAQAGLFHHYGIPKYLLPEKMFGVFPHRITEQRAPLLRGFDDIFSALHSRHTEVRRGDILASGAVRILSESAVAGVYIAAANGNRQLFVTGHPEYDQFSLKNEYERDLAKGLPIAVPVNYFPDNNPSQIPSVSWRDHANLFFTNWLNVTYQETPFDLNELVPLA